MTVVPDLGLGLVRHQGDALPPALAHALHQQTTRETGKFELFMFFIHCRLYDASLCISPTKYQCFCQDTLGLGYILGKGLH